MFPNSDPEKVIKLMREYQIPEVIAKFFGAFGLHETRKVETFFSLNIYELHDYNLDAIVIELQNSNPIMIQEYYKQKSPLLIHNTKPINETIKMLVLKNPGYIINDHGKNIAFDVFNNDKNTNINLYKNKNICKDLQIDQLLKEYEKIFCNELNCNHEYSLSLYKGINHLTLTQNKRNLL